MSPPSTTTLASQVCADGPITGQAAATSSISPVAIHAPASCMCALHALREFTRQQSAPLLAQHDSGVCASKHAVCWSICACHAGVLAALVVSNDTWAACKARGDVGHVPIPPVVRPPASAWLWAVGRLQRRQARLPVHSDKDRQGMSPLLVLANVSMCGTCAAPCNRPLRYAACLCISMLASLACCPAT